MFTVKIAQQSDLQIIQDIAAKTWEAAYGEILSSEQLSYMFDMMYSIENLERQQLQLKHVFFIFYLKDAPVGYLSIENKGDGLFNFQKIYVIPSVQGAGLGRFIINTGIEYTDSLTNTHPYKIELCVNRANKAVDFYKYLGFKIVDERDFNIGNNFYMNDYIMELICE